MSAELLQAGTAEPCVCPFANPAGVNTSIILLFYRKWRPHYTWQPEQDTRKWPNICSRTKPKSMPRPRWVLEVGGIPDGSNSSAGGAILPDRRPGCRARGAEIPCHTCWVAAHAPVLLCKGSEKPRDVLASTKCQETVLRGGGGARGGLKVCVVVTVTVSEEKQLFEESVAGENQDALAM